VHSQEQVEEEEEVVFSPPLSGDSPEEIEDM
jgi:hypothetical protein